MKSLVLVLMIFINLPVLAQDIHFFGSIEAAKTTIADDDINYSYISNKPTISQLSSAGLNLTGSLTDKDQVLSQFILINNSVGLDLLQLRHNISDKSNIRIGRQRIPLNLHSENIQVQALLPWMAAPREVYSKAPVYSFTGASFETDIFEKLSLHVFAGDTKDDFEADNVQYKTSSSDLIGGRLTLHHNRHQVFLAGYRADAVLQVKSQFAPGTPFPTGSSLNFDSTYNLDRFYVMTGGFHFQPRDFFIMSEYYLLSSKSEALERVESFYTSIGTEISEKWIPVLTFSSDLETASTLTPSKTSTYAFNLNYRLNFNHVLKFGIEHVNYKLRTVQTSLGAMSGNFQTNGNPGENFDVYSLMWAFVY